MRTPFLLVALLTLGAAACGGDADTTDASTTPDTTAVTASDDETSATDAPEPADSPAADDTEQPGDGDAGPSGTVVMTVGDTTVEADVVQCTVAEPDVQFRAEGETAQIVVAAIGGGETSVIVSGAFEFEGTGTAAFNPDTSGLDQGDVMIIGSGAQPDDSAAVTDFTVDARGLSC